MRLTLYAEAEMEKTKANTIERNEKENIENDVKEAKVWGVYLLDWTLLIDNW